MPAAWTTPRTWTAGELVTAAIGNSAWRDNLMYLKDSPTFDGNVTVTGTTLLTGVATFTAAPVFSAATASQAVFTNGSKALVSNAITGTGNVVMSASPTLTGTIAGAAMTLSSTLGVTGATTLSSTVATGALTVTGAATVSTTLGVTGATTLSSTVATGELTITGAATYTTNLKSTTAFATPAALTATQATAFASTVSGSAIMGFGTTNDVALMNRAGTVVLGIGPNTTTVNMTGLLSVTGFGTHNFSAGGTGGNTFAIRNTTSGTGNFSQIRMGNNADDGLMTFRAHSSAYTTAGTSVASGASIQVSGSGGLNLVAENASGPIRFYSGGTTERGRWETNGKFVIGTQAAGSALDVKMNLTNTYLAYLDQAATVDPFGLIINYSGANPNDNSHHFFSGNASGLKIALYSNGGIANYSANNVNLSDAATKDIAGEAMAERAAFRRLAFVRAKYLDSELPYDVMVTAQNVEQVYPDLVTIFDPDLQTKGVREHGLIMRGLKVIQELDSESLQHDATISQLAARIAALETKDN